MSIGKFMNALRKVCFKCKEEKMISHFYKHNEMADGFLNKCKECNKKDVKQNYRDNHEYKKAYELKRNKDPKRKEDRANYLRKFRKEHPNKNRARAIVNRLLRNGTIQRRPCEVCGSIKTEAHHPDYDKPYSIVWLCLRHHRIAHQAIVDASIDESKKVESLLMDRKELETMKLSKTSLGEYVSCQRKFWHSRVKKTDKDCDYKIGKALLIGRAYAECQEIFRGDVKAMTSAEIIRICERNDLDVTAAAQIMAMLRCYFSNVSNEEVEKCEVWLEHPTLTGRLDKIVRREEKRFILEEKTASEINQAQLSATLPTDPQLCLYASCAEQFEVEGIIYRVVRKPKERRKKEESWQEYTQRCTCEFLELRFAFDELDIKGCLEQFEAAHAEITAKKDESEFLCNKQNCVTFGAACAWYSRCHGKEYTLANGDW